MHNIEIDSEALNTNEISHIWNSYIFETMIHHILSYFANTASDYDIKTFTQYCHIASRMDVNHYIKIFNKENLPIPRGTTSEDVNIKASRLFSDKFIITYIKNMANFALLNFALAFSECRRDDIKKVFNGHLDRLKEVELIASEIMISKGIYTEPPSVSVRQEVEFIEEQSFFSGFFGDKRPLSALDIKHLFTNLSNNALGKALLAGFIQISKCKETQEYISKGKEVADKYMRQISEKLSVDNISSLPSMDSEVLTFSGSHSPFSDRLILNHTALLNSYGIGNYGMALSQSLRRDLSAMYGKMIIETGMYADKGADLLIQKKWLEQPPLISI